MARRETASAIDDAAATWGARIDAAPLTPAEQARLDTWLAGDSRRLGALARALAVLAHADRAQALKNGASGGGMAAAEPGVPPLSRRRLLRWTGAMAAAVAGVVAVREWPRGERLATAKGEIRMVPLPDGSRVTLDTASAVVARFDDRQRRIVLLAGEALFDVAKDRVRPFVVDAGGTSITAVGTSFSVNRLPGGEVRVVVREGVVSVVRPQAAVPVRVAANTLAVTPAPGAAAAVVAPQPIAVQEVSRRLAWTDGMLAFDGSSLGAAAAQFARYSDTPIVIADPALAARTITGLYSANDPRGFAHMAALSLDVRVRETPAAVFIER